jgi:hypothetical protein
MTLFHRPDPVSGSEQSDQAPRRAQHRGRNLSLRLLAFAVALVACLLAAGFPPALRVTPAAADDFGPAPLLNAATLSQYCGRVTPSTITFAQSLYCATPAQIQSLKNLEQTAITNTLADHGLPVGDAAAVQAWGRDDAEAELWGLLVQAIKAPACTAGQTPGQGCRSTDQQNAVDWLAGTANKQEGMVNRQAVQAANDAGLEYVKWAGMSQSAYTSDVAQYDSDASQGKSTTQDDNNLKTLLNYPPVNYNNTNTSQATGGYCVYRSPVPYASEYTGYDDPTCGAPCPSLLGCTPPTPSYDQFTKWGEADVNNALFNNADFGNTSRDIAITASFFMALSAAAGAAVATASGLGVVLTGSAFAAAIFPMSAAALTASPIFLGATEAAAFVGGMAAGAVAVIVATVIIAVVIAVLQGITISNAAALPGKLKDLIEGSAGKPTDLGAMLNDSTKYQGLYSLFVGATTPSPLFTSCDNNPVVPSPGGGPPTSTLTDPPCLNAPPIPGPANADPEFAIQAKGATSTTYASTLIWKDTETQLTTTARLHGNWFVDQETDSQGTSLTIQTLRMHYTDWSGNEQTAWLMGDDTTGYTFLGLEDGSSSGKALDSATCKSDGTCSYSSSIHVVGSDGKDYSVSVIPAAAPRVSVTASASPTEGSPITFTASATSPVGATITNYQWQFEQIPPCTTLISGSQSICGSTSSCPVSEAPCGPPYGSPVSGSQATQESNTWQGAGTFHVQVTVTDSAGKQTVNTFTVTVADVAPTLALTPGGPATDPLCKVTPAPCQPRVVPFGNPTMLGGTLTHAGSQDVEFVHIDWGDHTSTDDCGGNSLVCSGALGLAATSTTAMSFLGSHTYAQPGSYHATVTVSDLDGGTISRTVVETVQGPQVVSTPGDLTCSQGAFIAGTVGGDLIVDGTVCRVSHIHVVRDVIVKNGGSLLGDVVAGRNLQAQGAAQISLTGGDVGQDAILQTTTGGPDTFDGVWVGRNLTVQSSGAGAAWQIHNDVVMGGVQILNNLGSVDVEANRVSRTVRIQGNRGGVTVLTNHYSSLSCTGDVPAATGQCSE